MADQISFEIITLEGLKFQSEVYQVVLPTPNGNIGILPHHIPLITIVSPGVIMIKHRPSDTDEETLATSGGFVEIDGKRVRFLADTAERAEDIDELKVQEALERAQNLVKTTRDEVALADAVGHIEHSMARLKVAQLKRRKARGVTGIG